MPEPAPAAPAVFGFRISVPATIGPAAGLRHWADLPEPPAPLADRWHHAHLQADCAAARRYVHATYAHGSLVRLDRRRTAIRPDRLTLAGTLTANPPPNPYEIASWNPYNTALALLVGMTRWTLDTVYGCAEYASAHAAPLPRPVEITLREHPPKE